MSEKYNWKAEWYELRNQMECKEAIHHEEINALKSKIAELEDEYKNKYVRRETLNQYMWERDVAISQLEELGLGFGQKVDGMKAVNVNKLAESIEDKMTYMCGCRNCIETVTQIIKGDRRPFDSQCNECNNEECKVKQQ